MNELTVASAAEPAVLAQCPEIAIVIPTFNESGNIELLVERLRATLADVTWEAIFVDDNSPDGTAALAKQIGRTDVRIRCIRRVGRRGLSGACIEGMLSAQSPYVFVMDADLQHDESLIPRMLDVLRRNDADLVVASRYKTEGPIGGFSGFRERLSRLGTHLAKRLLHITLSDSLSGFFAIRRDAFDEFAEKLSPDGFKILLDIAITAGPHLKTAEIPFVFRARHQGESKLDTRVAFDFLSLLMKHATKNVLPPHFLMFCTVGFGGIFVHLLALSALQVSGYGFAPAQAIASLLAVTCNFWLNNNLTYRDQRLRGVRAFRGFVVFALICSFGFVSNIGVADWIFGSEGTWWLAGLAGAVMSAVWNYSVSAALVWRR